MELIESIGSGDPTRLFVGGLHGKEHKTTDPILRKFAETFDGRGELRGKLAIYSFGEESRKYTSTLKDEFYRTEAGKELLSVIERHSPDIYLELHSYPSSNYSSLISRDRPKEKGVPPLVDLGSGVLMHSISPILCSKFEKDDFCLLIDVPKDHRPDGEFFQMLDAIARSEDRREAVEKLEELYPSEMREIRGNYLKFYTTMFQISNLLT